jgi:hypothetical protein
MDIAGGKRLGTHTLVHRSDLNQLLKAFPQQGDAGWAMFCGRVQTAESARDKVRRIEVQCDLWYGCIFTGFVYNQHIRSETSACYTALRSSVVHARVTISEDLPYCTC